MKANTLSIISVLCAAMFFVGCGNEEDTPKVDPAVKIIGEWHCAPEGYDVDVYVAFGDEGDFDEYQRLGEGRYRHYNGTYIVDNGVLSGLYADGTEWGSTYTISFSGDTMTLTANNESAEAIVYTMTTIPEEVKEEAIEPLGTETRAECERWF